MVEEDILDLNEVRPIISSILGPAQTKVIEKVNSNDEIRGEKTNEE